MHAALLTVLPASPRRNAFATKGRVIAELGAEDGKKPRLVVDASSAPAAALVEALHLLQSVDGAAGSLGVTTLAADGGLKKLRGPLRQMHSVPLTLTTIANETRALRISHRLDPDGRLDLLFARSLTQRFKRAVPLLASIDYSHTSGAEWNLAMLFEWSGEHKSAYQQTCDALGRFVERARSLTKTPPTASMDLLEMVQHAQSAKELEIPTELGTFPNWLLLLGQRVGEMHVALAGETQFPELAPEEFTPFYQRSLYQSVRNHLLNGVDLVRKAARADHKLHPAATSFANGANEALKILRGIFERPMQGVRLRCHGELDLRNIVHTGKDFLIVPVPLGTGGFASKRAIKRTPLRDVAFILRSLQQCAWREFRGSNGVATPRDEERLRSWLQFWQRGAMTTVLHGYFQVMGNQKLLPALPEQIALLLRAHMIDHAVGQLTEIVESNPGAILPHLEQIDLLSK